jgi:hypothetical protein
MNLPQPDSGPDSNINSPYYAVRNNTTVFFRQDNKFPHNCMTSGHHSHRYCIITYRELQPWSQAGIVLYHIANWYHDHMQVLYCLCHIDICYHDHLFILADFCDHLLTYSYACMITFNPPLHNWCHICTFLCSNGMVICTHDYVQMYLYIFL